jgi:lipopolysaccharide export LptBFGC system permease protein LptF
MMLFQRRIFLELMGNALTTVVLLMAVLLLVTSVQVISSVDGLSLGMFMKTLPVFMGVTVNIVMPIAVLVAVVLTYGRAASDNEIDTLRASGIHPFHVLVPGLVFGALMSVLMLMAMDDGRPHAARFKRRITKVVDPGALIAQKLASGEPEELADGIWVAPASVDSNGVKHDMRIQWAASDGQIIQEIVAEDDSTEVFVDPQRDKLVLKLGRFRTVVGDRLDGLNEGTEIMRSLHREFGDLSIDSMTTAQLLAWMERKPGKRGRFKEKAVQAEVAMRTSAAAACLMFVLLGYPVALRFRRSDRVGAFLVAFLLALFLYYPSVKVSSALATSGAVPPNVAAWLGHTLLLLASILIWRRLETR